MANEALRLFRRQHHITWKDDIYNCACGALCPTINHHITHLIKEWMKGFNPGILEEENMPNPDIATYTCTKCGKKIQIEYDRIRSVPPAEEIICEAGHAPAVALRD